ncbi:MAG: thiosulfate oxidation carrier protein SoxY [Acidithiobacillus sp.]|nr:thiosulfate oxidation carrier protein SoxY [Acidithiobacillus sp.]
MKKVQRREFLGTSATAVAVAAVAGSGLLRAGSAIAGDVAGWPAKAFDAKVLDQAMTDSIGKTSIPVSAKVSLKAPTIAENGGSVPVTIEVDSPMTADDYISTVWLFVDHNPTPLASQFNFTPACGKAYIQERIKMAKTDNVRVVAKTNKGELMASAPKEVKVTIGGCGG